MIWIVVPCAIGAACLVLAVALARKYNWRV
jgi:hypothetical protein